MKIVRGNKFLGRNHVIFNAKGVNYRGTLLGIEKGVVHVSTRASKSTLKFTLENTIMDEGLTEFPELNHQQVLILDPNTNFRTILQEVSANTPFVMYEPEKEVTF